MSNSKKYGESPLEALTKSLVLIQVNQSLSEINEDRVSKAKALQEQISHMSNYSKLRYMQRRQISDDWRETFKKIFKKMGYVPCLD